MTALWLGFLVHNHQPVGNFDRVIEEAYGRAYLPFLELLERRSDVCIALHNSGCLWEWLELHHPEYGRRIAALVERGQVELLGGGFYEPILSLISPRDRRGQLRKMQCFLEGRFGVRPRGIWLAERVWEPQIAADLAALGIAYVCLDDSLLLRCGWEDEELCGSFLTEDGGGPVAVYPIHARLRYEIPFASPERVLETLRASADARPGGMRLYADDGEKFGTWPGTYDLCYEERWLDRFFDLVRREREWLRLVLPGQHLSEHPSLGRVYLPPGSYREMEGWASTPAVHARLEEARGFLSDHGRGDAARLIGGGFFRNFLVRYPEANRMHKRVAMALDRLEDLPDLSEETRDRIRDHLWRGQCNCAYWHGLFGGVYLPHLRDAVYHELLQGEAMLEREVRGDGSWVEAECADVDADGQTEGMIRSDRLSIFLSPTQGGGVFEIDDLRCARNLVNALARRPEAYHARYTTRGSGDSGAGTDRDASAVKEEAIPELLRYDRRERLCLADRFLRETPVPEDLIDGDTREQGEFLDAPYGLERTAEADGIGFRLFRRGIVDREGRQSLELAKTVQLRAGRSGFRVSYRLRSLAPATIRIHFGVEWFLNLLAGRAPDRYLLVDGLRPHDPALAARDRHLGARVLSLVDEWARLWIDLTADRASGWVRAPLETVSLSESGLETIYQGTIVMPYWQLALEPGAEWSTVLDLEIRSGTDFGATVRS